ncbi:phosphatase [Corynebacterium yudongzhengii]|uniref:HAD family phosphatase n=2 Tax=Corynebacterium yudongzhengii TaxID=2080740 RepID=A0A2U1T8P1_9CORY|nr:phosphatase [Corynebacterium yudongzhengii]PWC02363.1 HAD family phosphatase [Corynebacterium yudongzhengii]
MDGTMIDSEPEWGIATYEMSERFGRRLTPQLREKTIGGSVMNTMQICAEHAGLSLDDLDVALERRRLYARVRELIADLTPLPGVRELLEAFQGTPMLVTTNTERELADASIEAVGKHYFVGSVTSDEVAHPKPAPDMYLAAAQRVGVDPQDCLVFEDSWTGMTGATAAGCRVIGLADEAPAGAVSLRELHGTLSLEGVSADQVRTWYERLR